MTKVAIYHNILWSSYKGVVFSYLFKKSNKILELSFIQIAETEKSRIALSKVDYTVHDYQYDLLFKGNYEDVSSFDITARLIRDIFERKPDIVVLPGYNKVEYWAMLMLCTLLGITRGVFCDSTSFDRPAKIYKKILKSFFFGKCNFFFAYGERSVNYLKNHGVNPGLIFTRCQAASLPLDYSVQEVRVSRIRCARAAPKAQYLYVGRLSPEKGLVCLLKSFSEILKTYPDSKLRIVGHGPLGDYLRNLTRELCIETRVAFIGALTGKQLYHEYSEATCLILPSISEPWGLVVNESLSYGCPVVVSDACGCVPELVIDGISGYVFKTNDVAHLTDRVLLLTKEFMNLELITDNCLDAVSKFTPSNSADQIYCGLMKFQSLE